MREEQLIAEILNNRSFGEDVTDALADYLTAQARYINALAERKEIEVEGLRTPSPSPFTVKEKEEADLPW